MRRNLTPKMALGATAFAAALAFGAGPAVAQVDTYEETPPPEVIDDEGTPIDVSPDEPTTPSEQATPPPVTGGLPVTGGDVVGLAVIGTGAIAAGGAMLVYRRRLTT